MEPRKGLTMAAWLHRATKQYCLDHNDSLTVQQLVDQMAEFYFQQKAPEYLEPKMGRPRKSRARQE